MVKTVIKRDGKKVPYEKEKIVKAIEKAFLATEEVKIEDEKRTELIEKIIKKIELENKETLKIEEIQDLIEKKLLKLEPRVGKNFLIYRRERTKIRNKKHNEMINELITIKPGDLLNENANMAAETPSGILSKIGFESSKQYAIDNLLQLDYKIAHENGDIHIHDLDWYASGSLTCLASELDVILKDGYIDSHGGLRKVKRITSAVRMCAISMQKSQNLEHGAQMIPALDFYLAPYVETSFKIHLKKITDLLFGLNDEKEREILENYKVEKYETKTLEGLYGLKRIIQAAINETVEETRQAMKGFVHDLNSMSSRAGCQTVFSSVNLGTDTSAEGRLITEKLFEALEDGVGPNKVVAIYPITVFKVKKGANRLTEDPNYDLYKKAQRLACIRFYPTFVNLDATFNFSEEWKAEDPLRYETECSIMGCRSRIFENRRGKKSTLGRGNASFTTINLPRLAILAKKDIEKFYFLLSEKIELVLQQLEERLNYQAKVKAKQVWHITKYVSKLGHHLGKEDELGDFVKHFTLGVGYIGLAETLISLTDKHHGESEEARKLGLEIIEFMNKLVKERAEKTQLNFSVFASPAEGLASRFTKLDIKDFGDIKGVTDKGYYTNSHQIPMAYKMPMSHKIKVEAPYHVLTPAGHILRLEFDGDPSENLEAVSRALELALDSNAGYIGINHNDNYCQTCGNNFKSRNTHHCPKCGSEDVSTVSTVTGYLTSTLDRWNPGKKLEFYDRIGQDVEK